MDCPRCGSFCSVLDEACECGFDLTRARESGRRDSPRKKHRKRKKTRELESSPPDEPASMTEDDEDLELVEPLELGVWIDQYYATVLGMLFLAAITCGLYIPYWYIKRQPFFDGLGTKSRLGGSLPWVALCFAALYALVRVLPRVAGHAPGMSAPGAMVTLSYAFLNLYMAFYVRGIIHQAMRDAGQPVRLSGALTFLFNAYYLQYAMNRISRGTWGSTR